MLFKLKAVSGIMLTLLFIGMLTFTFNIQPTIAEPKIWTVDDDGPADFSKIQEAINAASPGDTIYVNNGTYHERVVVNKSVSLIGEEIAKPVINTTETDKPSVYISVNNVIVSGFVIRNFVDYWGIFLDHSSNSIFTKNIVKARYAISVDGGSWNKISENDIEEVDPISPCVFEGLRLNNSNNNIVARNYFSSRCHNTFTMINSHNNYVAFNYMANHFSPFPVGIEKSNNNSIVGNTILSWGLFGPHISFGSSNGNVLYHNSFLAYEGPNLIWIDETSMNNAWDNGYPSGGNYWSNYTDVDLYKGFYQNLTGSDGIWDHPYVIDGNNKDKYPLVNPWTPPVGGIYIPVNKLDLLAPYIELTILLAVAVITVGYVKKRKRHTEINP